MRLDGFSLLYLQGMLFLQNPWSSVQLVFYPALVSGIAMLIALTTALVSRVVGRSWLALFLAAALAAAIGTIPFYMIGAVQPYYAKVLVLLFDYLILCWAFYRFDWLTLLVASFTFPFFWQNYTLLVMFSPTGASEEWFAFAIWGLCVAASVAIAFKSAILTAYRRVATAFQ